ncbi:MAG: VWA domain-containing protein [Candidatus Aenigmatarchaeota archaeon]
MNKWIRGFLLSLDAIAAITLLLTVAILLAGISFNYSTEDLRYQRYYYAGKDLVYVLEKTKLKDISDVINLSVYDFSEEDMERSLIDAIGSFWAEGNKTNAGNLTKEILDKFFVNTGLNYEILFNNETIYSSEPQYPKFIAKLTTVVSGYEKTKPVNGYISKVYISKPRKSDTKFIYFGGYEGDGNITKLFYLPIDANVTNAYLEINVGSNFTLYINGHYCNLYEKTKHNFSADYWNICSSSNPVCCSFFNQGQNIVQINFSSSENNYVGGGYIKINYKTSELAEGEYIIENETLTKKYNFPGINGIINLYSSFYLPGTLKNISIYLHYKNNLTLNNQGIPVYLILGSKQVYRSNSTGEINFLISEEDISNAFGSKEILVSNISNKTVPIRFGTETFAFLSGEGRSDSVLITDVSGSMDTCDVETLECLHPDCNSQVSGCQNKRIDIAKDVDKEFVYTILNYSGNRVGLVSYTTGIDSIYPLTNNTDEIINEINKYTYKDATCISCGIVNATQMLRNSKIIKTIVPSKSIWLYNTSFPLEEPSIINGTKWTEINYTDDGWNEGQSILGFETNPYEPYVNTNIGNNGGNYYFRKKFNLTQNEIIDFADLYLLFDDAVEVYLNGQLVYNETEKQNASYWNRGRLIFYDDFESYYTSGANRLYSNEINRSPGFWIVNGTPSNDKEIFLMANYAGYPAHSGTDVLVFRDMDAYGYAEKYFNFSGMKNLILSYWWMLGPDSLESGEYGEFKIWDGSWKTIKTYDQNYVYGYYIYEEINLSNYNMRDNFTIRFGAKTSEDNERFYIDDVIVKEVIRINGSLFKKGENVIAVKLRNNDSQSAKFDMEVNATMKRYEAMLVMSDGIANRCVPGTTCPYGISASTQSIQKACEARDNYNINVYSVAFGSGADTDTLKKIACWNCSSNDWIPNCNRFYNSSNAEELKNIYRDIAEDIANATYIGQVFNYTGNISLRNILYPDSYIEFVYTPIHKKLEYGEITLNFESPELGNCTGDALITDNTTGTKEGWFFIPGDNEILTDIIDAKITSYSSYYWTDRLWVNSSNTPNQNWTRVFWLGDFGNDYEKLGDPYIIQIPVNFLKVNGNNSVKIGTGLRPSLTEGKGGSPDNRIIYTLGIRGITLTQFSDVLSKAKGSSPRVYYDVNGDNIADGYFIVELGVDPSDLFDPLEDAIDNGFVKLLDTLNFLGDLNPDIADFNHTNIGPSGSGDGSVNNPIDLEINEEIKFNSNYISQIPSMWGPAQMEIKIWGG